MPAEIADLREGFAGRLNVYRGMAHRSDLLRASAPLRQHVVLANALGPERPIHAARSTAGLEEIRRGSQSS
jgi:hypothetical protein